MGSRICREAFPPLNRLPVERGFNITSCSVVGGEDDQGLFRQSCFMDSPHDSSDKMIHISHHVFEIALAMSALGVNTMRSGDKRSVREDHRVIGEKRTVTGLGDEIDQIVGGDIRAECFFIKLAILTVDPHEGARIAFAKLVDLPKASFVEACGFGQGSTCTKLFGVVVGAEELPFADNGCVVPIGFEILSDGLLVLVKNGEGRIISYVRKPRHELDTRGCAQGLRVTMVKTHASVGQLIDIGR